VTSRRRFLKIAAGSTLGAAAATGLYTWRWEPEWLELVERELPIAGLPSGLNGALLVQMSDLHIGPRVDDDYITRTFDRVSALRPDIVAMTGDWITYRGPAQLDQLGRLLQRYPRGRLATVGILGNHDYGFGWKMQEVGDAVAKRATEAGVTMLRNEVLDVNGLTIIGLEDFWGPAFAAAPQLLVTTEAPSRLVLSHNPDSVDEPVWTTYQGWILSGHTHGGQCKPPFLPPPILPVRNPRYTAGEIALSGQRQLYINRGVGHLIRVRFNVRPEVTLFRLRPA
jgi:predicted MPP superfamily phosphohydrolase